MDNLDHDALQDLEARLYAQVHHESSVAVIQVSESQHQASKRFNRYWNDANPFINSGNLVSKKLANQVPRQSQNNYPPKVNVLIEKGPSPEVVVPQASGNDHGQNGSGSQTENVDKEKSVFVKPCKLPKPKVPKEKAPFAKQASKLERAKKLEQKKKRKEQLKAKKAERKNIETIVLETSDDNDDDVLEVPVPPPPCFTIDDSSSEAEVEKPGSRCPSPSSSVTSDDFIGQNDRSRLLKDSRADDVELANLQDSLSGFQETALTPEAVHEEPIISKPVEIEYRVTEPIFKAIDIYESELDTPDSIYQKGKKSVEPLEIRDSSSSLEEIPIDESVKKTKKWRKRRASGSNKESEHQSTGDEEEDNSLIPPYIVRGIAVEKCKEAKLRRRSQSSKLSVGDINSSDNEFINKLTTIAAGACPDSSEDEEEENITARAIVEDVLKKSGEFF